MLSVGIQFQRLKGIDLMQLSIGHRRCLDVAIRSALWCIYVAIHTALCCKVAKVWSEKSGEAGNKVALPEEHRPSHLLCR
ncbi:hypothetical protein Tco_0903090 [Tanacetum coccineum]